MRVGTSGTWHQLMSVLHLGQLSFLLRAASDTLPTAVNLRQWCVQSEVKCTLYDSTRPTTVHILGGIPVALTQQRYANRHNHHLLASKLKECLITIHLFCVYADLQGLRYLLKLYHSTSPSYHTFQARYWCV